MAGYFSKALIPSVRRRLIRDLKKILKGKDFDTIVVTGISGVIMGPIVAYALNKKLVVVRKDDDHSGHSGLRIAAHDAGNKYIILDDFSSTGFTMRRIHQKMQHEYPECVLVGAAFYMLEARCGLNQPEYVCKEVAGETTKFVVGTGPNMRQPCEKNWGA